MINIEDEDPFKLRIHEVIESPEFLELVEVMKRAKELRTIIADKFPDLIPEGLD